MSPHETDANDPWTFFGEFSKGEIDGATRVLTDAKIQFEVKEGTWAPGSGWSGPFGLWVRDESAAHASVLLTSYVASREKPDA
jgi:hypothetical protein